MRILFATGRRNWRRLSSGTARSYLSPATGVRASAPAWKASATLLDLVQRFENLAIIYPVHPNPNVRTSVARLLAGNERIHLTEPLDYDLFCHLMASSRLILTDSGGIQEEAPSLDKPVLRLRNSERPEAVEAGTRGSSARNGRQSPRRPSSAAQRSRRLMQDGGCQ